MASFRHALRIRPDLADAHYNLGLALMETGLLAEAAASLHQFLRLKPESVAGHCRLGDVLRKRGSVREALDYWTKALKAEDETQELDRAGVERKIREAQASLHDAAEIKRP